MFSFQAARFPSREQQYTIYNFHREEDLAEAAAVFAAGPQQRPPALLLAGDLGSGRGYFLHAALHRARQAGRRLRLGELDLEGHELGGDNLERFVAHQAGKRTALERSRLLELVQELKPSVQASGPQLLGASLFSISLGLDLPYDQLGGVLRKAFAARVGDAASEIEVLYEFFRQLTENQRFVLHVKDKTALPSTLLERLVRCARRFPDLVLAFSSGREDSDDPAAPLGESLRIEFPPLEPYELARIAARNFGAGVFSQALVQTLWQYSRGRPPRIAHAVRALIEAKLLREAGGGTWRIDEEASDEALAQPFEAEFFERFEQALAHVPAEQAMKARSFIERASVCGEEVPVGLLLDQMGTPEGERDDFLDALDEVFAPDSPDSLFRDYHYQHPSFPGVLTYGFANPVWPQAILDHLSEAERHRLAFELAGYLGPRLRATTRGAAHLLYRLAQAMGSRYDAAYLAAEMQWWVGRDEAEALRDLLTEAVRSRRIDADALWDELNRRYPTWPPYRALAVLEAYASRPDGPAERVLGPYWALRAWLLFELGRYEEAVAAAETGLGIAGDDAVVRVKLWNSRGYAQLFLRRNVEAEQAFRSMLEIRGSQGEIPDQASALHGLGMALANQGRQQEALPNLEQALALTERALGPDHPEAALTLQELGRLHLDEDRLDAARPLLERALAITARSRGGEHPRIGLILHELGRLRLGERRSGEAQSLFEQALAIKERALGPQHSTVAVTLYELGRLHLAEGTLAEARPLLERALAIAETSFGPRHPETGGMLLTLGRLAADERRTEDARSLLERACEILDQGLGREHPATSAARDALQGLPEA